MRLTHYGFLVMAPDYEPSQQNARLENPLFKTEIRGVSSLPQAIDAATSLINEGVQLIELCGGFSVEQAEELIATLDTHIPIGHVRFGESEGRKLTQLMSGT